MRLFESRVAYRLGLGLNISQRTGTFPLVEASKRPKASLVSIQNGLGSRLCSAIASGTYFQFSILSERTKKRK